MSSAGGSVWAVTVRGAPTGQRKSRAGFTIHSPSPSCAIVALTSSSFAATAAKIAYRVGVPASQYELHSAISLIHASMLILMAERNSTVNSNLLIKI